MTESTEDRPASVPNRAIPAGETQPSFQGWAEPSVWTERMLAALMTGVRGGKWYSLMDKVSSMKNLRAAFSKVKANRGVPGVDHVTVAHFASRREENLRCLSETLRNGTYRPQQIRRTYIPKPGSKEKRPLGIPTVRDRVVQTALRNVLEPIFEVGFVDQSYGFRPGRGCKDALRRVDKLLKAGYQYVVDADLKSYFDTIPHEELLQQLRQKLADGKVLDLVESFLKQGILEDLKEWTPEEGTPQGAVISPLLSNIYLNPLDHLMAEQGLQMVRYADDFVVLCRTTEEARQALHLVEEWTAQAGLTLHPDKTRTVTLWKEGFEFLGYRFHEDKRWPRAKSLKKLKDAIRKKTRRNNGHSLDTIITHVNQTLRGWFEYFQHSHKWTYPKLDSWIRMRLRSILRRRQKRKGRGRGKDHQRWPNAFFRAHGLFSLETAHALACQPSSR